MRWPPPRAHTAQPERWRMRRWSKEPRRMSVVEGREVASLARALSVCFIYQYETIKQRVVSRVFQTFLRDFVFSISRPDCRPTESELIIWKARSHFLQKIFCSAPNRVARRADQQRAVCQPDRIARAESSSTRPTYASPGSRTRSVAPAYRLFDPG